MMLIIPAMDFTQGHCVRKIQGEPGTEHFYEKLSENPHELAKLWRIENAKSLHITDRDSLNGNDNSDNIASINDVIDAVDIPVELYSDFKSVEECEHWLEEGCFRLVLTTLLLDDPDGVRRLVDEFTPSRVVVGMRTNNRVIDFAGEYPTMKDIEFANLAKDVGIKRIVYSDANWEGTYFGPDVEILKAVAQETSMRITASGGIDSPQELWMIQDLYTYGVDSVVVGRALFENRFPCQKIWRLIEAESK
ncbi:MAG: HisA/HisF-related TIM barrel protein [Candidatus Kapaibacterium sp.]